MTVDSKWRRALAWLRRKFPPPRPVRVRRASLPPEEGSKVFGETVNGGRQYTIKIEGRQSWPLIRDTLLHEWAHILTWNGNDTDDHGEEWGLQYARIYREYVAWNFGEK